MVEEFDYTEDMNKKILPILSSILFFASASCFLIYAFTSNLPFMMAGSILLCAAAILTWLRPKNNPASKQDKDNQ